MAENDNQKPINIVVPGVAPMEKDPSLCIDCDEKGLWAPKIILRPHIHFHTQHPFPMFLSFLFCENHKKLISVHNDGLFNSGLKTTILKITHSAGIEVDLNRTLIEAISIDSEEFIRFKKIMAKSKN